MRGGSGMRIMRWGMEASGNDEISDKEVRSLMWVAHDEGECSCT